MANPSAQSYDEDEVIEKCQVCGHSAARRYMFVFSRGKNIYGLTSGTVLCGICLGQHEKWMKDNGFWTGSANTTLLQDLHAVGLEAHLKTLLHPLNDPGRGLPMRR